MQTGREGTFIALVLVWLIIYIRMDRARRGHLPEFREIAGISAIDEAIGRATEMGRPIVFTGGGLDVTDATGPQTVAGLEVLAYLAETTARQDVGLVCTVCKPNVQALTEGIVRDAYAKADKAYRLEMVRFLSPLPIAYGISTASLVERENAAATIMVGAFAVETVLVAEAGSAVGAIQIGGTAQMVQLPFFVVACDYTLIGEEIYAGGAYLSKNALRLGSLAGQDLCKLLGIALLIIASVATTLGIPLAKYLK